MAIYTKIVSVAGEWVKKDSLTNGQKAKIVSETNPQPSAFLNKDGSVKNQDVCKVLFQGEKEGVLVNLNRANINALVDAFGEDSKAWIDKVLTVELEKMRVAGKAVTALYLIPDGYKKIDDAEGYAIIVKMGLEEELNQAAEVKTVTLDDDENIKPEDMPF